MIFKYYKPWVPQKMAQTCLLWVVLRKNTMYCVCVCKFIKIFVCLMLLSSSMILILLQEDYLYLYQALEALAQQEAPVCPPSPSAVAQGGNMEHDKDSGISNCNNFSMTMPSCHNSNHSLKAATLPPMRQETTM